MDPTSDLGRRGLEIDLLFYFFKKGKCLELKSNALESLAPEFPYSFSMYHVTDAFVWLVFDLFFPTDTIL